MEDGEVGKIKYQKPKIKNKSKSKKQKIKNQILKMKSKGGKYQMSGNGQASLELTAALIVVAILIVGALKIFVWFNARLAMRQAEYERTRVTAGSVAHERVDIRNYDATKGVQVDDSGYEALNLF